MARISWNPEKADKLRQDEARNGVGFEDCVVAIEEGRLLADLPHPLIEDQRLLIFQVAGYAYVAPYVQDSEGIFLKTVYPSRKYTSLYLNT